MRLLAWLTGRPPLSAEERARLQREREREREQREAEARRDAAVQAQREREAEEVRVLTERQEASAAALRAHVERYGFWFPSDRRPAPSRLSARSRFGRVIEALFGNWP